MNPRMTSRSLSHIQITEELQVDPFAAPRGGPGYSTTSTAPPPAQVIKTPTEVAEEALDKYLNMNEAQKPTLADRPVEMCLDWWKQKGSVLFPLVAKAAQVLLATRGSAGTMERDFCGAGTTMGPKRSTMDPALFDMAMVLMAIDDDSGEIPDPVNVKGLTDDEAKSLLPNRYQAAEFMEAYDMISSWNADQEISTEEDAWARDALICSATEDVEFENSSGVDEEKGTEGLDEGDQMAL
jgi:hypothetical protein